MSVGRICVREVDLAAADESVVGAARRMGERRVGTLIILNDAQAPIGVVTDRDLVTRVLATGRDPQSTRVGEIMTRDPKVIEEDSPIESALSLMRAAGVFVTFERGPVPTPASAPPWFCEPCYTTALLSSPSP